TVSLNPNIGAAMYESDTGTFGAFLGALTVSFNPTNRLSFFVDGGLQAPEEKQGKTSLILDTGLAYIVNKDLQLDFSVGQGVSGNTPPRPFVSAGISLKF